MPYPRKGQTKEAYVSEFMRSAEAQHDFPDEKQRLAVAYSLWEKRNSRLNSWYGANAAEEAWPREYECNFIEPGVVHYQDLGACKKCGTAGSCGEGKCEPTGETVLVDNNALAKMAKSFVGKSVLDKEHADVDAGTIDRGEADGIVTRVWLDAESGWWKCRFIVWDPETQRHCESPAYSVSCAYNPTDVDSSGGTYHNLDYQQKILDGEYTHLAVVTNPRYEGARIQLVNSKDGKGGLKMNWKFWDKNAARRNASSLDPAKTLVTLDGKKISLQALFNAAEAPAPKSELGDDTVLEHDGKEMTLGELKAKARANMKNAEEDMKCPACDGSGKKAAENADAGDAAGHRGAPESEPKVNADSSPVADPLPDMRNPKVNGSQDSDEAEAAAKAAEKAVADKKVLELEQSRKNEAAARDAKDKAEAEAEALKNARDAERRNAARRSFEALKNAASERSGPAVNVGIVSQDDRLARGKAKYGKKDSVPA